MPIVFAPPEPFRQDISQGYGAAEQFTRTLPVMQRYQQGEAEALLQAGAMRQRAAQASAELQLRSAQGSNALDQRSYEANLHAAMQQQQMAHQSDMLTQQAHLQDQLAQSQLSRGEQLRLQRLQEARGLVQDQVASGILTREEGQAALLQIQTGINPLQQRQQRAQLQMQELQYRTMQTQAARQDQLWRERQEYHSSTLQDRLADMVDPMTGERHQFYLDEHGNPHLLFEAPARGAGGAMASGGGQQAGGRGAGTSAGAGAGGSAGGRQGAVTPQVVAQITHQVEERMDQERQNPPAGVQQAWASDPQRWVAERDRRVRERVALMQSILNPPQAEPTQEQQQAAEYQQALLAARRANPRLPEAQHRQQAQLNVLAARLRREQAQAGPQPLVPNAREHEGDRAFSQEELGRMELPQREAAQGLNNLRELLGTEGVLRNNVALSAERRENLTGNLNQMQRIIARYGSVASMPPAEQRRYAALRATLVGLQAPRQQAAGAWGGQFGEQLPPPDVRGLGDVLNRAVGVTGQRGTFDESAVDAFASEAGRRLSGLFR